jgi:prepilin-type processing-associated H-X9-DG protein
MTERSIFLAVLEIDNAAERDAYLDQACAGDAALRGQVEQLLRAHQEPGHFMQHPAPVLVATVDEPLTTSYAANFEVFGDAEAEARLQAYHRFPAFITDIVANTIFFAERYQICNGEPNGWGFTGDSIRAPGFNLYDHTHFQVTPAPKECEPGTPQSAHEGGINVGMGDGSVLFVSEQLSWATWRAAPNAGDLPGADW